MTFHRRRTSLDLLRHAHLILLPFLLLTARPARAQVQPSLAVTGHPDTAAIESRLVAGFAAARAAQHLRPLTRIPDRPALRQLTCTAAQTGDPPHLLLDLESNAASAIVKTDGTGHLPADFDRIVSYSDGGADPSHRIERYSISVWPDSRDPAAYWIGVALYWSRLRQAFAGRFTLDYRPLDFKPYLAPACRNVR